jgi:hypothetical protein
MFLTHSTRTSSFVEDSISPCSSLPPEDDAGNVEYKVMSETAKLALDLVLQLISKDTGRLIIEQFYL